MNTDPQQIAKIQHRLDTMRRVLNKALDEVQSQLDAMGGAEEQQDTGIWKRDLRRLLGTKK